MGVTAKAPLSLATVTHKSRSKKRFARVDDPSLIEILRGSGKPIKGSPRAEAALKGALLVGIYSLPSNNVMELYEDATGTGPVAYIFSSLDVWMSFSPEDLIAAP